MKFLARTFTGHAEKILLNELCTKQTTKRIKKIQNFLKHLLELHSFAPKPQGIKKPVQVLGKITMFSIFYQKGVAHFLVKSLCSLNDINRQSVNVR